MLNEQVLRYLNNEIALIYFKFTYVWWYLVKLVYNTQAFILKNAISPEYYIYVIHVLNMIWFNGFLLFECLNFSLINQRRLRQCDLKRILTFLHVLTKTFENNKSIVINMNSSSNLMHFSSTCRNFRAWFH